MSSASSSVGSDVSSPPQSTARQSGATTVMIRNIPCKYTQENVMEEVSAVTQNYDFLYMPPARGDGGSKGYAFVNFCDEETASRFLVEFQGHAFYRQPNSLKRAEVVYAEVQGLMQNVKFYKRCKAIKTKFRPYINKAALKTTKK
jgi:RNA recognition motif-containing protein